MDAMIAILAGGRGARMGGDKVLTGLGGRALISYPVQAALDASGGGELLVIAKDETRLPDLGDAGGQVRVVREHSEPVHPLAGIVAGLREGAGRALVVVAADMPFVTWELLRWLAGLDDELAVPAHGGRLHPLLGRYETSLLDPLEAAMETEEALQEVVASLGPRKITGAELVRFGDPERLLFNVNTREDLEAAEGMLG